MSESCERCMSMTRTSPLKKRNSRRCDCYYLGQVQVFFQMELLPNPTRPPVNSASSMALHHKSVAPMIRHVIKNASLLCLSLTFLPFTSLVVLVCQVYTILSTWLNPKHGASGVVKTILVTGVNMNKGLSTARLFHSQGHRVIGADTHRLSPARVSVALSQFYVLPEPCDTELETLSTHTTAYVTSLLQIIKAEKVDLWVSVSDVNAAIQDAQARQLIENCTNTRVIQLQESQVEMLHNKALFMNHVHSIGLRAPETKTVLSAAELIEFLSARGGLSLSISGGTQYLVKPVDINDIARFGMALVPRDIEQDTLQAISTIPFKDGNRVPSFQIQEYIQGREYCTHALVIGGQVRAFVACPSASVLMHYSALSPSSHLSQKMLHFTRSIIEKDSTDWTGHLSFDFIVRSKASSNLEEDQHAEIYPIECNPRVHTAVVLFNETPGLVEDYLSVLEPGVAHQPVEPRYPRTYRKYYWLGQDFVELAMLPTIRALLMPNGGDTSIQQSWCKFWHHLCHWKDATFEVSDPWPFWWLYHVYWPVQFAWSLRTTRWQMINVSTGKVFKAA